MTPRTHLAWWLIIAGLSVLMPTKSILSDDAILPRAAQLELLDDMGEDAARPAARRPAVQQRDIVRRHPVARPARELPGRDLGRSRVDGRTRRTKAQRRARLKRVRRAVVGRRRVREGAARGRATRRASSGTRPGRH